MSRSMLECIMYPAEYQQVMLRRQLVLCMAQHASFFYKLLIEHIRSQYGPIRLSAAEYKQKRKDGTLTEIEEIDQNLPGPFSFLGYLEYLLKPVSWGDQGVLVAVSMMWQLKITVVTAEKLHQERIRHDGPMAEADMLLIFCGGNHYVLAGKSRDELRSVPYGEEIVPWGSGDQFNCDTCKFFASYLNLVQYRMGGMEQS